MKARNWCVIALVVTVAAILGITRPAYAVLTVNDHPYASGAFLVSVGATPAFIVNLKGGSIEADVVNPQSRDASFGPEVCRMGVVFYDANGAVLQASELKVGPGETGIARLAPQNVPPASDPPSPLRVTFQALDTDSKGSVRPCLAIPSVQIVDMKQLRTVLLVPVVTN
jgi:hypothetical protein